MESATKFLTTKLKLKVNHQKSAVARPWERKFLGFTFTQEKGSVKITVHKDRIKRLKDKIKSLTRRMRGNNLEESIKKWIMPITRGWANYFRIAETKGIFEGLDGWIRRKIRAIQWRQWKKCKTRCKQLILRGINKVTARKHASSSKGPWRRSRSQVMHRALSNSVIESMGYIPMAKIVNIRSQ